MTRVFTKTFYYGISCFFSWPLFFHSVISSLVEEESITSLIVKHCQPNTSKFGYSELSTISHFEGILQRAHHFWKINIENKFHQLSLGMVDKEFQFGELGEIDAHK